MTEHPHTNSGDERAQIISGLEAAIRDPECPVQFSPLLMAARKALVGPWRTDIENAPKDGSEVLFPIEFVTRAYWDDDLKRWVMSFGLKMDYVNHPSRFAIPKARV